MGATLIPSVGKSQLPQARLSKLAKSKAHSKSAPGCVKLRTVDEGRLLRQLSALEIETPSWGYGNSGTRFHVYPWPGAARTAEERIADAALVHRLTGCCPRVAIHIPWDRVEDYAELSRSASSAGIELGAVNPNLFGEDDYR